MRGLFLVILSVATLLSVAAGKSRYPEWVADSLERKQSIERFASTSDALVLHDEARVEYLGRGKVENEVRRCYYIYNRDGRHFAKLGIPMSGSDKLEAFEAWIIYPSGKVERFRKSDLVEIASDRDMLKSESREFAIDRSESMRDGTVFAFEYKKSEQSVFLQGVWQFDDVIPVAFSVLSLNLPKEWRLEPMLFRAEYAESEQEDGEYMWLARDLEAVKIEESQPFRSLLTGKLAYSIYPDERELKRYPYLVFDSWTSVAKYIAETQADRISAGVDLEAKTKELLENAASRWDRIREICTYAQSINYLAMAIDLNSGGGMTPQDANDTFANHYGDCKDMTALARAMLSVAGIESYPTIAMIGDDSWVYTDWASPLPFNHCILAVPLDENDAIPEGSGIVEHPARGHFLIFDPTTKNVPPGVLPHYLEGRNVLIGGTEDRLLTLPVFGPKSNRISREIEARVDEYGTLAGEVLEENYGAVAEMLRQAYRSLEKDEFDQMLRNWIQRGARDAEVVSIECEDRFEENKFDLRIQFRAKRYARVLKGGELLLVNPVFLGQLRWVPPTEEERTTPYVVEGFSIEERSRIEIPSGYVLDSARESERVDTELGSFALEVSYADQSIVVKRSRKQSHTVMPVDSYPQVVDYFEQISRAESAPVVFKRAP